MQRQRQAHDISAVFLPRECLLRISSQQLADRVAAITSTRDLSHDERTEVARQRRLVSNRETAQKSRRRKKQELMHLNQENEELREYVAILENRFEEQILQMQRDMHILQQKLLRCSRHHKFSEHKEEEKEQEEKQEMSEEPIVLQQPLFKHMTHSVMDLFSDENTLFDESTTLSF